MRSEVMMRAPILCNKCRQRLSLTDQNHSRTVRCQACNFENKIPPSHTRDQGKLFQTGIRAVMSKNKIFKSASLNHKPSTSGASGSSSQTGSRKRALLIGVSYKKSKFKLNGTMNDVKKMNSFLVSKCGFRQEDILILSEDATDPELIPTKKNIRKFLKWLVEDCQEGDSLVFHFSGHGLRQPDFVGDEKDGFDETICPVDFMEEGMISDNEIYSTIVKPLQKGVVLHAIIDGCHSGTVLDLAYVYNRDRDVWEDNSPRPVAKGCTEGGLAISLCACKDDQVAADTNAFEGNTMSGALTYSLVETLKGNPGVTYGRLLDLIYEYIEGANQKGCLVKRVIKGLLNDKLLQKPQLSASETFNVYEKPFAL